MNVRTWLRDELAARLEDGWLLLPYDTKLTPAQRTVMFFRSRVVPTPEAPRGSQTHTITLYVATAAQVGPDALDDLDDALDDVLVALFKIRNVVARSATYKILGETVPCFEVLVDVPSKITETEE